MIRQQNPPARSEERRAGQLKSARLGIMMAAARIVIQDGYQATTMRTIAREAGYTASSLYTYFKSKEEIFAALREEIMTRFNSTVSEELPEGLDFPARVAVLTHRLGRFAEEHEDALALHIVGGLDIAAENGRDRIARLKDKICAVRTWFETQARPEDLGGHSAEDAAELFSGIMGAAIERTFVNGGGELDPEALRAAHARAAAFFFAALKAPPQD